MGVKVTTSVVHLMLSRPFERNYALFAINFAVYSARKHQFPGQNKAWIRAPAHFIRVGASAFPLERTEIATSGEIFPRFF